MTNPSTGGFMVCFMCTKKPFADALETYLTYGTGEVFSGMFMFAVPYGFAKAIIDLYNQSSYTTTDSITTTETTVATGIQSATSSKPTFTGDGVRLVTDNISTADSASFTGDSGSVSVSGTPEGTVSKPTFTGDGVRLVTGNIEVPSGVTGSFEGTQGSVSVSGTPEGTVSKPTFTGDTVKISGETTSA